MLSCVYSCTGSVKPGIFLLPSDIYKLLIGLNLSFGSCSFYEVSFCCPLQVPSYVLMGIPHSSSCTPLSALGEACSRGDLTAIHEILENIGYKDDEGVTNEVLYFFLIIC